jgi:hypothetical protein
MAMQTGPTALRLATDNTSRLFCRRPANMLLGSKIYLFRVNPHVAKGRCGRAQPPRCKSSRESGWADGDAILYVTPHAKGCTVIIGLTLPWFNRQLQRAEAFRFSGHLTAVRETCIGAVDTRLVWTHDIWETGLIKSSKMRLYIRVCNVC